MKTSFEKNLVCFFQRASSNMSSSYWEEADESFVYKNTFLA